MERRKCTAMHATDDNTDLSSMLVIDSSEDYGWEVRLVLELCDRGSLKELLNNGGLRDAASGKPDMVSIVATALDVARAMLHLHTENVIHSDLKVWGTAAFIRLQPNTCALILFLC